MEPAARHAVRALRASARGHLTLEPSRRFGVRFVWDRPTGRLLFPMPADAQGQTEAQLLAPDEHDPAVAALLSIEQTASPPPAAELRFEIYHGRGGEPGWALAAVEALRHHGEAFDRDELALTDHLHADEPALCRGLNADAAALRALCEARAGARVEEPVAVGVDPDGIDIRARFGIVRIEFDQPADTAEQARERIARMMEAARA